MDNLTKNMVTKADQDKVRSFSLFHSEGTDAFALYLNGSFIYHPTFFLFF